MGPVKRVFKKEESGSKEARDHSILIKDRPHYVTILTLGSYDVNYSHFMITKLLLFFSSGCRCTITKW